MPLQSSVRALKKPLRLDDEVRFLRSWIEKPLHMGAVMPSSKLLARTMAQYVDVDSKGPVIELGPGTGAITNALIEHGVDQKRLVLVEYNPGPLNTVSADVEHGGSLALGGCPNSGTLGVMLIVAYPERGKPSRNHGSLAGVQVATPQIGRYDIG